MFEFKLKYAFWFSYLQVFSLHYLLGKNSAPLTSQSINQVKSMQHNIEITLYFEFTSTNYNEMFFRYKAEVTIFLNSDTKRSKSHVEEKTLPSICIDRFRGIFMVAAAHSGLSAPNHVQSHTT